MENLSGLYMIRCRTTGEYYIGATATSFRVRFAKHRLQLASGRCTVPLLQSAVDRHGLDAFDFVPLCVLQEHELARREREAIETLKPALNTDGVRPRGKYRKWGKITVYGETMSIYAAAAKYGIESRTIRFRIEKGITGDDLVAPAHRAPRKNYTYRA